MSRPTFKDPEKVQTTSSTGKKERRRRKKKKVSEFEHIQSLHKLTLSPLTQQLIGCIAGEHVTGEDPWIYIDMEQLVDDLEMREDESEFLPLKEEIMNYKVNKVLIGYSPDEVRGIDEFYICLSKDAEEKVNAITDKIKQERSQFFLRALSKTAGFWKTLNSDGEIEIYRPNRGLYEVEVESAYPMMIKTAEFRFRTVQKSRDGYAELLTERIPIEAILMKRVDRGIQSAPTFIDKYVQTIGRVIGRNMWTQYEYTYEEQEITPAMALEAKTFIQDRMGYIYDSLIVTGGINFYRNDYRDMIVNISSTIQHKDLTLSEFMSFSEINLCKNKMISDVSWHPFLTGIIAGCYVDTALNNFIKSTYVRRLEGASAGQEINPVLMWSCVNGLKPTLILETLRQVTSISFCPYDDNFIVGGCSNGQVIIWDIKDKLKQLDEVEFLLPEQQVYRSHLNQNMTWSKNIKDISLVPVAVNSDLAYSHMTTITQIEWMPPYEQITNNGLITKVPKDSEFEYSYQFLTCSLDGDVLFWDLRLKSRSSTTGYRAMRRMRRLKKRPSALTVHVSPLRVLNRALRPVYKLSMTRPDEKNMPVFCIALPHFNIKYKQATTRPKKKLRAHERIKFDPIIERTEEKYPQNFCVGSSFGHYMSATWEGYEYSTGEVVMQEPAKLTIVDCYHDGPMICLKRWEYNPKIILSIGGKVFCLWDESLTRRPVMWRKGKVRYTSGAWNPDNPATFSLTRSDGVLETWNICTMSYRNIREQTLSGKILTGYYVNKVFPNICGIGDHNGILRIYQSAEALFEKSSSQYVLKTMNKLLQQQKTIVLDFEKWQQDWVVKNYEKIQRQENKSKAFFKSQMHLNAQLDKADKEVLSKDDDKAVPQKSKPPPGKFREWAEERWREREQKRMHIVLLELKHLNPESLKEQQKPLKKIMNEEKLKRQKQKKKHEHSEKIFNETVAMYFPHVLQKPAPPPKDPYAGGDTVDTKELAIKNYNSETEDLKHFISSHPYRYKMDWRRVIKSGVERRNVTRYNSPYGHPHKNRYRNLKTRISSLEHLVEQEEEEVQEEEIEMTESELMRQSSTEELDAGGDY